MFNPSQDTEKRNEKNTIVKKVSVSDTLRAIKHGETVQFHCSSMYLGSVRSAICRLNKQLGRKEYTVISFDNGQFFGIKRI